MVKRDRVSTCGVGTVFGWRKLWDNCTSDFVEAASNWFDKFFGHQFQDHVPDNEGFGLEPSGKKTRLLEISFKDRTRWFGNTVMILISDQSSFHVTVWVLKNGTTSVLCPFAVMSVDEGHLLRFRVSKLNTRTY